MGSFPTEMRARWLIGKPLARDRLLVVAVVTIVAVGATLVALGGFGGAGKDAPALGQRDFPVAATQRAAADGERAAPGRRDAAPAPATNPAELAGPTFERLTQTRHAARARLARAKTADAQAVAARQLEAAYADAARRIERLHTDDLAGLAGALRSAERAYGGLAVASANVDQERFDRQRRAVMDAEAAVARQHAALR